VGRGVDGYADDFLVPCLGLGPSAHSFEAGSRWWDVGSIKKYCRHLKCLKKEFEAELGAEVALRLLKYSDLKNLLAGILTIEGSILQSKIVEDPAPLQGKKTVRVLYPDPVGTVAFPADEFLTLEEARTDLQKKILQLFWQIAPNILDPVLKISLATLQPDLR
jgi:hypothetical protein